MRESQRDDVVDVVIDCAVRDDLVVAVYDHRDTKCETHEQGANGLEVVE